MLRRHLFLLPAALAAQSPKPREWVTAAASRDTAPRVALIPSTFKGAVELDKRRIRALTQPAPLDAPLSPAQLDDMFLLAVELGGGRRGGLRTAIGRDEWVVLKASPAANPHLLAATLRYLAQNNLGRRITLFDAPLPQNLARQFPAVKFEQLDSASAPGLQMPVEGRVFNPANPQGLYKIPRALRECDKLISLAPLTPNSGTILNYRSFAPPDTPGDPALAALDIFSFHPADYAILGPATRHNVLIAASNATAVDSVGAAVLNLEPEKMPHLNFAVQRGYGSNEAYAIWTRGAEIEEVRTPA